MTDKTEAERVRELKPCPFCGFTVPCLHEDDQGQWEQVVCEGCGAKGPEKLRRYSQGHNSATAGWNARSSHEPLGDPFAGQAMPGDESPVSQQEIVSAINHYARKLARLTETWPAPPPPDVQREVEMWRQVWDNVKLDVPNLREDNKPLAVAAAYALARLDAERYRWLRNQVEFYDGVGCFPELHGKKGQSIDEAIDAARASETKGMSAHNGKAVVAVDRLRPIDNHAPPPPDVQGWQPIETAPRDTPILLSIFASGDPERERLVVVGGSSDGVTWIDHYDYEIHPPTHWMPLPSAPSTKEKAL